MFDIGCRAVSGIDYGLIGHGEQFGTDSVHEGLMVAVGEICAAVTTLKHNVARKDALLLLVPEYQTAG